MKRKYLRGAYPTINKSKWRAQIKYNYKNLHIGIFKSEIDAHQAYIAAFERLNERKYYSDSLEDKILHIVELAQQYKKRQVY